MLEILNPMVEYKTWACTENTEF